MALLNQSVQVYGQIGKLFEAIRAGQAPDKFNREYLRDLGFKSSNHVKFIPWMKGLGFISADGAPLERYKALLDPTGWKKAIAEALKEAYGDIFTIKSNPGKADLSTIVGKYRGAYNLSPVMADRAARTFLALLELADPEMLNVKGPIGESKPAAEIAGKSRDADPATSIIQPTRQSSLHYNIEIHLPATKDLEVYNAIFKSLKEHLFV